MTQEKMPKGNLEISDNDNWKSCIMCGGTITQVRKALFTCLNCNQEYIVDEEDMREEIPFKYLKAKDKK
jgi:predicted RNA-binding Zn-ribbon protein involved in translation (DUF1610 family)